MVEVLSGVILKRLFDFVVSLLCLLFLWPMIAITYLLVLIRMGRPVLFVQQRPGLNAKPFNIYKFRTMLLTTDDNNELLPDDKRMTALGSFLRKYSLDELPQLWSILKGDMSFVGPRPALFNQEDLIALRTSCGVHELVPGLTGWAQINGRDELPILEKVKLDAKYLQRQSFWFDVRILWLTFLKVIQRDGVSH